MIGYQVYVRSFRDGNLDGVGDFKGLTEALGYLKELSVNLVWLMPVFSSITFHGYDVVDFKRFKAEYGTKEDFLELLKVFHDNGIKVVLDFPIHHTSILHEWFQRALRGERKYRDYYVWADEGTNTNETRDWDGERIWHPSESGYYRGLFGPFTPDLNFANPEVVKEMRKITVELLEMGIDGFRFDAAKHMRDTLEENVAFWKEFLDGLKGFFIAEVWADPEVVDAHGEIFGHMLNFDLSYCVKDAVSREDPRVLADSITRSLTARRYVSLNFTSNHDMNRLASFSDGMDIRKMKLVFSLLFTLPGIPVIFYGDELGMRGIFSRPHTDLVLDPFPWEERMCSIGQTFWKWPTFNDPFSGISVDYQKRLEDSLFNHVVRWARFRGENAWIDGAEVRDLRIEGKVLCYNLSGEGRELRVCHNFSNGWEIVEGVRLGPFGSEVM